MEFGSCLGQLNLGTRFWLHGLHIIFVGGDAWNPDGICWMGLKNSKVT